MAVWYSLWSFVIFFPIKNLATLLGTMVADGLLGLML
jgi:hypothetical protein